MDETFTIRTYGFGELAQLYFPNISKNSASWQLNRWIRENSDLTLALEKAGKRKGQRLLSPAQVKLIVQAFGEP